MAAVDASPAQMTAAELELLRGMSKDGFDMDFLNSTAGCAHLLADQGAWPRCACGVAILLSSLASLHAHSAGFAAPSFPLNSNSPFLI